MFTPARRTYEQNELGRYIQLLPKKKRIYPGPRWECSTKGQLRNDMITRLLKWPSSWPTVEVLFEYGGSMKTSEALLRLGPVGAYQFQFVDCDPE